MRGDIFALSFNLKYVRDLHRLVHFLMKRRTWVYLTSFLLASGFLTLTFPTIVKSEMSLFPNASK